MIKHLLVAVDDSPGALSAARVATQLAQALGATMRAVMVIADGKISSALDSDSTSVHVRLESGAAAVLRHVTDMAQRDGVPIEALKIDGPVAACVLEQARAWPADLVVLGRSRQAGAGHPFIGSQARIVLEFAEVPVLVIPPPQ